MNRFSSNRFCSLALLLFAALALFWLPGRADAQFSFTLSTASVSGAPGDAGLTFYGTLTNSGSDTLPLDQLPQFNLLFGPAGADLTAFPVTLDSFFVPDSLAPGTTAALPLFSVAIDSAAPLGQYQGNLSFGYGGQVFGSDSVIVNAVAPQAVPEMGSAAPLALGLVCLALLLRRRASPRSAHTKAAL